MGRAKLIILSIIILALNLIWEFSHFRLYVDLTGIPVNLHLVWASFVDVILVSCIFCVNSFFRGRKADWIKKPKGRDYLFIVILGMLIAIFIEVYSIAQGRWVYTSSMPIILGIGLSPLVQLFTTGILGLWLFKFFR